jgi:hypothetical protein
VQDARSNAENAAHVGDRGFIAVFAVATHEDGIVDVSIVATTSDGRIGHVVVEVPSQGDDLDIDRLSVAAAIIRSGMRAARRAADTAQAERDDARRSASASPSATGPEVSSDPSSTPSAPPPPPSPEGVRVFPGPSSKDSACSELITLVLRGRDGSPLRGTGELGRRPTVDPRTEHPRDEEGSGSGPQACSVDRTPRACGLIECSLGTRLDLGSCSCRPRRSWSGGRSAGCSFSRCREGSHPEAVGPGCLCLDDQDGEATRPEPGPPATFSGRVPTAIRPKLEPLRGWGAREVPR